MTYDEPRDCWPAFKIDFQLLAGMMEAGEDLYLTGLFGGFGGSFFTAHRTLEAAKSFCKEYKPSGGLSIFKLVIGPSIVYVDNNGVEHQP
jgi:hypothetical protein